MLKHTTTTENWKRYFNISLWLCCSLVCGCGYVHRLIKYYESGTAIRHLRILRHLVICSNASTCWCEAAFLLYYYRFDATLKNFFEILLGIFAFGCDMIRNEMNESIFSSRNKIKKHFFVFSYQNRISLRILHRIHTKASIFSINMEVLCVTDAQSRWNMRQS